jgi:hypothetical protein
MSHPARRPINRSAAILRDQSKNSSEKYCGEVDHTRRGGGSRRIFIHACRIHDRGADDSSGWWIYVADTEVTKPTSFHHLNRFAAFLSLDKNKPV